MAKRIAQRNVISSVITSMTSIIVNFLAQRIFLQLLSVDYLGLNGLFTNILSVLSIFELGIGSAITFSLYRPLATGDHQTTEALMIFYKKAYRIVALLVGITGFIILPFITLFIKEVTVDVNIYIVYALFIIDTVCSYLLSYRRSILYADQKAYQINFTHCAYLIIVNVLQLTTLAITHNYYLYLLIKIAMRILENAVIHILASRQYRHLAAIKNAKLDSRIEKSIFKKIRALVFHKVGGFIIFGTDNIIISTFIGLVAVGQYSNYYLFINAAYILVGQAASAFTPTVGHRLVHKKAERNFDYFWKTRLVTFAMANVISVTFLMCIQPFIKLWLGEEFLLDQLTVTVLGINLFMTLQRYAYAIFKDAAGIYYEDRFVPLVEATINIVASIALLQFFGLAGVFMGTILSGLTLWGYSFPRLVYKGMFGRSYVRYAIETISFIVMFAATFLLSSLAAGWISGDNLVAQIAVNAGISIAIASTISFIAWIISKKRYI